MRLIDIKTDGGSIKGKIALYCAALHVTRQGFYWYLTHRDSPWKYEKIAEKMRGIVADAMTMLVVKLYCEAIRARLKEELLYGRYDTKKISMEQLKTLIWRYFIVYWNNRRICSANGGLSPLLKRKLHYALLA